LFTAAAAVFVEVAKRRTLRDIKLAADAMPYTCDRTSIHVVRRSARLCAYLVEKERERTRKRERGRERETERER
jgi:hypothetical protein